MSRASLSLSLLPCSSKQHHHVVKITEEEAVRRLSTVPNISCGWPVPSLHPCVRPSGLWLYASSELEPTNQLAPRPANRPALMHVAYRTSAVSRYIFARPPPRPATVPAGLHVWRWWLQVHGRLDEDRSSHCRGRNPTPPPAPGPARPGPACMCPIPHPAPCCTCADGRAIRGSSPRHGRYFCVHSSNLTPSSLTRLQGIAKSGALNSLLGSVYSPFRGPGMASPIVASFSSSSPWLTPDHKGNSFRYDFSPLFSLSLSPAFSLFLPFAPSCSL